MHVAAVTFGGSRAATSVTGAIGSAFRAVSVCVCVYVPNDEGVSAIATTLAGHDRGCYRVAAFDVGIGVEALCLFGEAKRQRLRHGTKLQEKQIRIDLVVYSCLVAALYVGGPGMPRKRLVAHFLSVERRNVTHLCV